MRHKQTDELVASGQTRGAEEAPRAALPPGRLFAREAYVVHVISSDLVEAASCEFLARGDGEPQEVTLLVRRPPARAVLGLTRSTSVAPRNRSWRRWHV